MSFRFLGLGTAVPEHSMSQQEATALAHEVISCTEQQARLLTVLYRKSGVKNRYTSLPHRIALTWVSQRAGDDALEESVTRGPTTAERMKYFAELAPPLALEATRQALQQSGIDRRDVTHLVTVCCTGFAAPGVDVSLIKELGLRPTVQRIHIGFMGCHGAINGLRVAHALGLSDHRARVLLCAVELCSLHYRLYWDPDRMVGNALFADGAAAVVAGFTEDEGNQQWAVAATGSCLIANSQESLTWRIGDHGFEMTLEAYVPDLIYRQLRPWLSNWLAEQGQTVESIQSWAIHPGGPRILDAVESALGLNPEAIAVSRQTLSEYGNMSSPTILFILRRLREQGARTPCVALGFGPGMAAEAALFM
jgi:predicted naringenin-chalcone synthase